MFLRLTAKLIALVRELGAAVLLIDDRHARFTV